MDRAELIAKYTAGYEEVVAALEGITPEELDAREGPGEWSPRQIVHHLSDSEMTSAIRIRRIIVEDNPVIQAYDERAFVDTLFTDGPIETALAGFAGARSSTIPILKRMTEEQWAKFGTHSETGIMTAENWLEYYSNHAHDHAAQIRRARATVRA